MLVLKSFLSQLAVGSFEVPETLVDLAGTKHCTLLPIRAETLLLLC